MSNKNLDRPWCIGKREVTIAGNFVPLSGSGTIVASKVQGLGFGFKPDKSTGVMALAAQPGNNPTTLTTPGILRTGTGVYTIVFEDPYLELLSFQCELACVSGGVNSFAQMLEPVTGLATANTGPTVTITIVNGSGTPVEGATTQRLYFIATFRDSTVGYVKP